MQVLVVRFSPTHAAANVSIAVQLHGNASSEAVSLWGKSSDPITPSWQTPPGTTQIRIMADYSLLSRPEATGLQPLQLRVNLTKHYGTANIKPVSPRPASSHA